MRNFGVAIAMASAALAALTLATPAQANAGDVYVCRMTDIHNNSLVYSFGWNTKTSDRSGTFVEVAFAKNGQWVASPVGLRPIWTWGDNQGAGAIVQNSDPTYALSVHYDAPSGASGPATLFHWKQQIAHGYCRFEAPNAGPSQAPVRDQGWTPQDAQAPAPYTPPPAPRPTYTPPPAPAPVATPTGSDSIALFNEAGGLTVNVTVGNQPLHALVDTGASDLVIPQATADELLKTGQAHLLDQKVPVTLADGSTLQAQFVRIDRVSIGNHIISDLVAGITPGNQALLGIGALNKIGRFTIDAQAHLLVFG